MCHEKLLHYLHISKKLKSNLSKHDMKPTCRYIIIGNMYVLLYVHSLGSHSYLQLLSKYAFGIHVEQYV